jgi:hypothetical protein
MRLVSYVFGLDIRYVYTCTHQSTSPMKNVILLLALITTLSSCGSIPPNHFRMPNPIDRVRYIFDPDFVRWFEHERMKKHLQQYPLPALKPERPLQLPKPGYEFVYRADKTVYGTVFFVRNSKGTVTTFSPDGFRLFFAEHSRTTYGTE